MIAGQPIGDDAPCQRLHPSADPMAASYNSDVDGICGGARKGLAEAGIGDV